MDEFCETGVGACDLRRPGVLHNVILQLEKQESDINPFSQSVIWVWN